MAEHFTFDVLSGIPSREAVSIRKNEVRSEAKLSFMLSLTVSNAVVFIIRLLQVSVPKESTVAQEITEIGVGVLSPEKSIIIPMNFCPS